MKALKNQKKVTWLTGCKKVKKVVPSNLKIKKGKIIDGTYVHTFGFPGKCVQKGVKYTKKMKFFLMPFTF